jgi:adenosine deaminase
MGHPPSKFARVFAKAAEKGLKLFAHAGEEGPPSYVYEALDILKVDRIDHGNRSLEDDALVQKLVAENMVLTVCPLSNLKLCVVDDLKNHPLKTMLDLGLRATVNSDDPSYFGGYLNDNYIRTADAVGLSKANIVTLVENGFTGAYLSDARRAELLGELAAVVEQHP